MLSVSVTQVASLLRDRPEELDSLQFGTGAPLPVPVTARLDSLPWTPAIDIEDAMDLALHLSAAALITVGYLSGMRPEEVLSLERGCCTTEQRDDGTTRHLITGRHFKGVTDENGNTVPGGEVRPQPWTVIEPVHRAIMVLEELTDGQRLFPRELSKAPKPRTYLGDALTTGMAADRISRFTAWASTLASEHGREHEMIPADPGGAVTMRRFRRTRGLVHQPPAGRAHRAQHPVRAPARVPGRILWRAIQNGHAADPGPGTGAGHR
jgi:integrase